MHPKLEPVLTETFGIMIYQEQVQRAAQVLAGYTRRGDKLRRAMGKKIKAEMDPSAIPLCKAPRITASTVARRRSFRSNRCLLWLQQKPCRRLCPDRLPDSLFESSLPGGIFGRLNDL